MVGEGAWVEELLDQEGRLAALVAHLSRASHHLKASLLMKVQNFTHHKKWALSELNGRFQV